jgi:hypothetical protein
VLEQQSKVPRHLPDHAPAHRQIEINSDDAKFGGTFVLGTGAEIGAPTQPAGERFFNITLAEGVKFEVQPAETHHSICFSTHTEIPLPHRCTLVTSKVKILQSLTGRSVELVSTVEQ